MNALERPRTLPELFSVWRPGLVLVAGGTDWVIKHHGRLAEGVSVADLSVIEELRGIALRDNTLHIGAMETMTRLHSNQLVKRYAAAVADAAYVMGSEQIRTRATIGGNVANSSPAADTPASLAALGARAVLASRGGERTLPVEELVGRNQNSLAEGEIIKEFTIPADDSRISAFMKIGSRSQVSISRINIAVSGIPAGGLFKEARVYVGTLGSPAKRCREGEAALQGSGAEKALQDALCVFAASAIPGRSTLPYKQSALRALALDVTAVLRKRAGEGNAHGQE